MDRSEERVKKALLTGVSVPAISEGETEYDKERLKKIKLADYDSADLFLEYIHYKATDRFKKALQMQSRNPLFALEEPGAWTSINLTQKAIIKRSIKKEGAEEKILPDGLTTTEGSIKTITSDKAEIQYISKTLASLSSDYNGKVYLKYVILSSDEDADLDSYIHPTNEEYMQDIKYITYVFEDTNNKIYFLKNTITNKGIRDGYYRVFTIFSKSIVKWTENNNKIRKYIIDPSLSIDDEKEDKAVYPIIFGIGDRSLVSLLIDVQDIDSAGASFVNFESLQKKVIAVQTYIPNAKQLKKDLSPSWVAKRVDYNKYGIACEDVTLRNGNSYYWDIGRCWKATTAVAESDARKDAYWKIEPYLKGSSTPPGFVGESDVTKKEDIDFSVNILPEVIAKKSYAMIVDDESFDGLETNGQKGIYFQNTQGPTSEDFEQQCDEYGNLIVTSKISTDSIKGLRRVHPNDTTGSCFYNNKEQIPNNGKLIEAKDKIFDVYFITKEPFAKDTTQFQYNILDKLKNGYRELSISSGATEKKYYIAKKYKEWMKGEACQSDIKSQIKDEKTKWEQIVDSFKEKYNGGTKPAGYIEKILTKEEIDKTTVSIGGNVLQKYNGLKEGDKIYEYPDGTILTDNPVEQMTDDNFEDLKKLYVCPLTLAEITKHFTYHEATFMIRNASGNLVQGEYLLSFGYNQERITNFTEIWDLFKSKFAEFNKNALPNSINKTDIPYWKQEGEYVLLNKAFVETFFESEEACKKNGVKVKDADLRPTTYNNSVLKKEFELTSKEIKNINDKIKTTIEDPFSGFTDNFIDSKVEYVFDRFYDMVCDVWGKEDDKGIRRTKGYFVGGTPFALKKSATTGDASDDLDDETGLTGGFDARELLDYILEKTMARVNERDLTKIVFGKLKTFFEKNKRSDFTDEEILKKMYNTIDLGATEAIITSSKRSNYGEMKKDIAKNYAILAKALQKQQFYMAAQDALAITTGAALSAVVIAGVATHFTILSSTVTALAASTASNIAANAVGPAAALFSAQAEAIGASCAGGPIVVIVTVIIVVIISVVTAIVIHNINKRNEETSASPDYVYKFTCRAKRALRQYSMTKRGPLIGPEIGGIEGKKYGDVKKNVSYYNWLAENGHGIPSSEYAKAKWDITYSSEEGEIAEEISQGSELVLNEPYDGRVMVILPTTDEALSDDDVYSMYGSSPLQKVEDFIQTWMGRKAKTAEKQYEIPIQGYYDFYTGMHPWVQVGFRKGLGACGKKIAEDGEYYCKETGEPFIFVQKGENGKNNYYSVKKEDDSDSYTHETTALSDDEAKKLIASQYIYFDSTYYPYFKQLQITDNGVKNLKLTLFDANFGSYTTGFNNGVPNNEIYSLEAIIRASLRSPVFIQDEDVTKYSSEAGEIKGDYVSIDTALEVSPTNLKIRFGYDDTNQNIISEKAVKEKPELKKDNEKWKEHYTVKSNDGITEVGQTNLSKRDHRWWDVSAYGITNGFAINGIKKYIQNEEIQNYGAEWVDIDDLRSAVEKGEVRNSLDASVDHYQVVKSWAQTCQKSREMNFMITGYTSTLKNNGIEYEITAIETKDANVMRTRFLQRYAEITANPEEVLYILMHIFNEDNNGNNVKKSNVKILLISDEEDSYVQSMKDRLNMEYEVKNMREDQFDGTTPYSIYEKAYQTGELEISEEYLRKITLSLGGASATRNYGSSTQNGKPLYKTLAQLLNEFCSLCPPKKRMELRQNSYNSDGENVLENQESTLARPLKWFSVEDIKSGITYVCLYYRTVMKIPKIRVYTWGPNNPTTSCVKNISIKNSNEFGVLSGIRSFDGTRNSIISRSSSDLKETERYSGVNFDDLKQSSVFGSSEYIGIDARNYDNAFASSMYEGNITILGDPFWNFDGMMQPCTMPLKLNVIIPQSEFAQRSTQTEDKNVITNSIMFRNSDGYNEGPGYAVKHGSIYDATENFLEIEKYNKTNQVLHEISGYYVVKEIKHNITPTSFTTDLNVMSYPNIQKDVLLSKEEYDRLAK